jgi:hypothetical protein
MITARPDLDPAAAQVLDAYLGELASRLSGPVRARQAVLAELGDGLVDATQARLTGGASPAQAAAAAVSEFGDPATVAHAFAPELAATCARRTALALITTGPLVGSLWLAALVAGGAAVLAAAPPWQWPVIQAGGWPARLLLAVIITTVLAAWLTVAATGPLTRWLPTQPGLPPITATAAAGGTGLVDLGLLAVLTIAAVAIPDAVSSPPRAWSAAPWPPGRPTAA